MKLILASPTYGPTDPAANRSLRTAIMHSARNGHEWLGDASPDRFAWAVARNRCVEEALKAFPEEDASMFWADSDVIFPIDAITRLAGRGHDFITGIYFQRYPPHWPLIAQFNKERGCFQWMAKWPKDVIAPMDGCGFGCVLTSLKMLKEVEEPWFEYKKFSEDFDFCLRAEKLGYQLHVDTSVLCGHLMDPIPATINQYTDCHPDLYGGEDGTIRPRNESRAVAV
jgi:hypothetical protein